MNGNVRYAGSHSEEEEECGEECGSESPVTDMDGNSEEAALQEHEQRRQQSLKQQPLQQQQSLKQQPLQQQQSRKQPPIQQQPEQPQWLVADLAASGIRLKPL